MLGPDKIINSYCSYIFQKETKNYLLYIPDTEFPYGTKQILRPLHLCTDLTQP